MKVRGDIEHVNLATGKRFVRVTGDGESRLVPCNEHGVPLEDRIAELERRTLPLMPLGPRPESLVPDPEVVDRLINSIKEKLKMPHYKDGTPAEVGDFVKGKPYNTDHEVVGTLVQITEGTESCNCIVAFAEPRITPLPVQDFYGAGLPVPTHLRRVVGGRIPHNGPQPQDYENVLVLPKTDYGEVKAFTKIT
jgi:hypothetical protein